MKPKSEASKNVTKSDSFRDGEAREFVEQAGQRPYGLVREILGLLSENKKWWLLPLVLMLMAAGLVVVLGGSTVAPFIYTLF